MSKMSFMLGSALVLVLQSGCMGEKNPKVPIVDNSSIVDATKVGIGLTKGEIKRHSSTVEGYNYYGQISIEPQLSILALKGPEAQTFFDHVSNVLGERRKNFGLSATPIIDGRRLPEIVLFNYSFDSVSKQWITYLNEEPRTRMTLLKPGTTLSFELRYISIDGKTFNQVKNITKDIYGSTMLLAGASIKVIDLIADNVSNILSSSVDSSTVLYFRPTGDKAKKSVEYIVKTKSDKTLAKVKFSLILRNSVVSGTVVDSQLNKVPHVNSFTNPLNAVYASEDRTFTLYDKLQQDESIATFSQIHDPSQFRTKCGNIINKLETYGLNLFDRYNAFYQILEAKTNFFQEYKLYTSGCLAQNKLTLLSKMGIPFTAPKSPKLPRIEISDESLTKLGSYMLNPIANIGFKNNLSKIFTESVIVESDELMNFENFRSQEGEAVMSPEEFIESLGKIGVARFGIYNGQRKEFAQFFFRPLNSEILYRIKLNRTKKWGKIRNVFISTVIDDEIPATKRQKENLRVAANNTVLGYENDVLNKKNLDVLALSN